MKSSDIILLFFIIYDIVITIVFTFKYLKFKEEYNKLDKYNEELFFWGCKIKTKMLF